MNYQRNQKYLFWGYVGLLSLPVLENRQEPAPQRSASGSSDNGVSGWSLKLRPKKQS